MKLTIEDGRDSFYTFDTNRILLLTATDEEQINQVEFSTEENGETVSWTSDVLTGEDGIKYVQVPNEFLNGNYSRLVCYYVALDSKGEYTRQKEVFRIRARQEPEDYFLTYSERVTFASIKALTEQYKVNASNSADLARRYAEENEDVNVEAGTYSSKHWSTKANKKYEEIRQYVGSQSDPTSALGSIESARTSAVSDVEKQKADSIKAVGTYTSNTAIPSISQYVESTAKPALKTYGEQQVDSYVNETSKPELDRYVNNEKKQVLENYTAEKKSELDNYTETDKKQVLDSYTENEKKAELDSHTAGLKEQLNAHTVTKTGELNEYTTGLKSELDGYTTAKEQVISEFTEQKKTEVQGVYQTDLNKLKGDLDDIDNQLKKEIAINWISGQYIKASTGIIVNDNSMKRTDYIDVSKMKDGFVISGTKLTYVSYNWWYKSDKTPLSQVRDFAIGATLIPPTDAEYIIMSVDKDDDISIPMFEKFNFTEMKNYINGKLDKNQGTGNAGKYLIVNDDGEIECKTEEQGIKLTEEKENQIVQCAKASLYNSTKNSTLKIALFTDVHADSENLARYIDFCKKHTSLVDAKLFLGDATLTKHSDDFTFWTNTSGTDDILFTIGNHDVWIDGTTSGGNVPKTDAYTKFFGTASNWGVVQPTNASENGLMYYYKDFSSQNIRLIVLDSMYYDDAENTWFSNVLNDALANNMKVICASHYQPTNERAKIDGCKFYSILYGNNYLVKFDERALNNVDSFIGNGGSFITWFCGDVHFDSFSEYIGTNGKQLIMTFDCTQCYPSKWYDNDRTRGTVSQDSINFICIDVVTNTIKLVRVGNTMDMFMQNKDVFCYDYINNKLLN